MASVFSKKTEPSSQKTDHPWISPASASVSTSRPTCVSVFLFLLHRIAHRKANRSASHNGRSLAQFRCTPGFPGETAASLRPCCYRGALVLGGGICVSPVSCLHAFAVSEATRTSVSVTSPRPLQPLPPLSSAVVPAVPLVYSQSLYEIHGIVGRRRAVRSHFRVLRPRPSVIRLIRRVDVLPRAFLRREGCEPRTLRGVRRERHPITLHF